MKFGLSDQQYEILNQLVIQPLKQRQATVYVFGSRAREKFHPFSDIDLLYIEDSSHPKISDADLSKIKEDVENSNLVIKVDLVNEVELADSYRDTAMKDRKLL